MILVIGASGILGQHLRLEQPENTSVVYTSQEQSLPRDFPLRLTTAVDVDTLLERWHPDVVLNLVGENRPDVVEKDPAAFRFINVYVPVLIADWCKAQGKRLVHVSTQGVFGGRRAPYAAVPLDKDDPPVNVYGRQKREAEIEVLMRGAQVARVTFLLGVRPCPHVGRANPLEQMIAATLANATQTQVADRIFSICWAEDAARRLWALIRDQSWTIAHVGSWGSATRMHIAAEVIDVLDGSQSTLCSVRHDEAFPSPQWAPRPKNTRFAAAPDQAEEMMTPWPLGLARAIKRWRGRLDYLDGEDRALELSLYLGISRQVVLDRLARGFGHQHMEVAKDFRIANPESDDDLLRWYAGTTAYIWELTAYHLDAGFNYFGMVDGIITHLKAKGCQRVLCLGDGVGDLSMKCHDAGLQPVYHDLASSKTADFAAFRMKRRYGARPLPLPFFLSPGWEPPYGPGREPTSLERFDAIVALDFFEHLTDVEGWARACWLMLRPGGLFVAQNAFGIGNEPGGTLPMHLERNNRFVSEWDPMMDGIGFVRTGEGNWRRKP